MTGRQGTVHAGVPFRPINDAQEAAISIDRTWLDQAAAHLEARNWASAADAFRRACPDALAGNLPADDQLRRNLALNMADLLVYRPEVLRVLESTPQDGRFRIEITPTGRPTVAYSANGNAFKRLSEGDDPLMYLAAVMKQLKPAREAGQPLSILGSADGYLLVALARHPWPLALGRQQCVHFFEAHPGNLMLCLMIHDFSGDAGPIRQPRFQWWIGRDCIEQYRDTMLTDLSLPFPALTIASLPDGPELARRSQTVLEQQLAADKKRTEQIRRRYDTLSEDTFIDATGPTPSRRPRAVLLTTRFSTVLRYSTADCAEALQELGWDAHVLMEPTPYHTLTYPLIRDALIRHEPDVVIQIDHLRAEHGDLFPPNVPFLCWAQDHLPNLTSSDAGRTVTAKDFMLTTLGPWYERTYGYPAEQIVPLAKLTRVPALPTSWTSDGPDFTYVSNAAKRPEDAVIEVARSFAPFPETAKLAENAGRRLLELYAEGKSFHGTLGIRTVVLETATRLGLVPESIVGLNEVVTELLERVNNLCYRQQALGWLADLADEMALDLAIYGSGWDKQPRFAKYARGTVNYGADLEALTRASKINFQIVPYFCLHQRLLDGLAAGGFFLVRAHPADSDCFNLARFLDAKLPEDIQTLGAARAAVHPNDAAELEALAANNSFIADRLDAVELVRVLQATGLFRNGCSSPPRIADVSFASTKELRERVEKFLKNSDTRRAIALEQHKAVADLLSYKAGMKRVLLDVHRRLLTASGRTSRQLLSVA